MEIDLSHIREKEQCAVCNIEFDYSMAIEDIPRRLLTETVIIFRES